jgi:hypothetical protein
MGDPSGNEDQIARRVKKSDRNVKMRGILRNEGGKVLSPYPIGTVCISARSSILKNFLSL